MRIHSHGFDANCEASFDLRAQASSTRCTHRSPACEASTALGRPARPTQRPPARQARRCVRTYVQLQGHACKRPWREASELPGFLSTIPRTNRTQVYVHVTYTH